MRRVLPVVLVAGMLLALCSAANAGLIELLNVGPNVSIGGDALGRFNNTVRLTVGADRVQPGGPSSDILVGTLYSSRLFSPADVGQTFIADRETDPAFGAVTDAFTSGSANLLRTCLLAPLPPLAGGCFGIPIDLQGLSIDSWHLTLDSLRIFQEFISTPQGPQLLTRAESDIRLAVNVVPEPAVSVLLACGLAGLGVATRRRRWPTCQRSS